jgi:hypothetical protein
MLWAPAERRREQECVCVKARRASHFYNSTLLARGERGDAYLAQLAGPQRLVEKGISGGGSGEGARQRRTSKPEPQNLEGWAAMANVRTSTRTTSIDDDNRTEYTRFSLRPVRETQATPHYELRRPAVHSGWAASLQLAAANKSILQSTKILDSIAAFQTRHLLILHAGIPDVTCSIANVLNVVTASPRSAARAAVFFQAFEYVSGQPFSPFLRFDRL